MIQQTTRCGFGIQLTGNENVRPIAQDVRGRLERALAAVEAKP